MGDDNNSEAAKKTGISSSNFTRWKKGARADPDFVVKVARAYGKNVLEALVEAEFITDKEANLREVRKGGLMLSEATEDELAAEVLRRMKRGLSSHVLITDIRDVDKRLNHPDPWLEGRVPDFSEVERLPFAADSSVDEDQERENRGEDI